MPQRDNLSAVELVAHIDSMALATYTWVRQQTFEQRFIGLPVSAKEEADLAAGFLAGLRVRLMLAETESMLLAYVYALMAGDRTGADKRARELLSRTAGGVASCSGYLHGLNAARELLNSASLDACASLRPSIVEHSGFKQH